MNASLKVKVGSDGKYRVYTVYGGMTLDVIAIGATREEAIAAIPVQYRDLPVR